MRRLLFIFILLTLSICLYGQIIYLPNPPFKVKWIPATYRGIKLGKSTYHDVKKIFGKPRWEGQNEDKIFDSDREFEKLLQYPNQGIGKEAADVVIGEKTKIVKAISFFALS